MTAGRGHLVGLVLLVLVVAASAAVRIQTALGHEKFDTRSARGMVLSDPGLLYYLTERVVEADGIFPDDFRADPRIEHPTTVDVPARFTVGQELVVALARRVLGDGVPLHVLCVQVMGVLASLVALGVYGLAYELTRSARWAGLAAVVYALLPANYRTIGFVLVREDLALPLFAAHLWLLARTVRTQGRIAAAGAGLTLGLTLATWHAGVFLATLEAAALFAWFLWSDRNPLRSPAARVVLVAFAVPCVLVPVLWAKGALLGPPMILAGGLLAAATIGGGRERGVRALIALGGATLLLGASRLLSLALGTADDFAHVLAVLAAKVAHLGVLPDDPGALGFEARMMWQGPFATTTWAGAIDGLQWGLLLLLPLLLAADALRFFRRSGDERRSILGAFLVLACVAAWLVSRVSVLVGVLLPVSLALAGRDLLARTRSPLAGIGVAALVAYQGFACFTWLARHDLPWHSRTQQRAVVEMLTAIEEHVPAGAAVAADFMSSTAVLAHTRRPILFQPKWESATSRRRVEAFWTAFHSGTPDELRVMLLDEYDCEYLLVDRLTLWWNRTSRYLAGYPADARDPRAGTAAAALLAGGAHGPSAPVPGYELVWRGTPVAGPGGRTGDVYRLFRLSGRER